MPSDESQSRPTESAVFVAVVREIGQRLVGIHRRLGVIERTLVRHDVRLAVIAAALNLNTILQEKTMSEIDDLEAAEAGVESVLAGLVTEVQAAAEESHAAATELDQLRSELTAAVGAGDLPRIKAATDRLTTLTGTMVDATASLTESVSGLTDAVARDAEPTPTPTPTPTDGGATPAPTDTGTPTDTTGTVDTGEPTDTSTEPGSPAEPTV